MTNSGLTGLCWQLFRIDCRLHRTIHGGRSFLNKVNHRDFQPKAMQHVDSGQASRADAIDFDEFAADDINADKVQTILDETVTD